MTSKREISTKKLDAKKHKKRQRDQRRDAKRVVRHKPAAQKEEILKKRKERNLRRHAQLSKKYQSTSSSSSEEDFEAEEEQQLKKQKYSKRKLENQTERIKDILNEHLNSSSEEDEIVGQKKQDSRSSSNAAPFSRLFPENRSIAGEEAVARRQAERDYMFSFLNSNQKVNNLVKPWERKWNQDFLNVVKFSEERTEDDSIEGPAAIDLDVLINQLEPLSVEQRLDLLSPQEPFNDHRFTDSFEESSDYLLTTLDDMNLDSVSSIEGQIRQIITNDTNYKQNSNNSNDSNMVYEDEFFGKIDTNVEQQQFNATYDETKDQQQFINDSHEDYVDYNNTKSKHIQSKEKEEHKDYLKENHALSESDNNDKDVQTNVTKHHVVNNYTKSNNISEYQVNDSQSLNQTEATSTETVSPSPKTQTQPRIVSTRIRKLQTTKHEDKNKQDSIDQEEDDDDDDDFLDKLIGNEQDNKEIDQLNKTKPTHIIKSNNTKNSRTKIISKKNTSIKQHKSTENNDNEENDLESWLDEITQ